MVWRIGDGERWAPGILRVYPKITLHCLALHSGHGVFPCLPNRRYMMRLSDLLVGAALVAALAAFAPVFVFAVAYTIKCFVSGVVV